MRPGKDRGYSPMELKYREREVFFTHQLTNLIDVIMTIYIYINGAYTVHQQLVFIPLNSDVAIGTCEVGTSQSADGFLKPKTRDGRQCHTTSIPIFSLLSASLDFVHWISYAFQALLTRNKEPLVVTIISHSLPSSPSLSTHCPSCTIQSASVSCL